MTEDKTPAWGAIAGMIDNKIDRQHARLTVIRDIIFRLLTDLSNAQDALDAHRD